MKKWFITAAFVMALLAVPMTRYNQETGRTYIRVDDHLPGAFVVHGLSDVGDNLWRAFIAVRFDEWGDTLIFGRANDAGDISESNLEMVDTLVLAELWRYDTVFVPADTTDSTSADSTYIDTVFAGATSIYSYGALGLEIEQIVNTSYDADSGALYIPVDFILHNESDSELTGGQFLFFYDADIPPSGFADDTPRKDTTYFTVFVQDGYDSAGACFGFCFVGESLSVRWGNHEDWFDMGTELSDIRALIDSPVWDDSLALCDASVYGVLMLPDMASDAVCTVRVAFVAGMGDNAEFLPAAAEARGDSFVDYVSEPRRSPGRPDALSLTAYPNPFNSSVKITVSDGRGLARQTPTKIAIYDLQGNVVGSMCASTAGDAGIATTNSEYIWTPDKSIASGIYLVRASVGQSIAERKIIYLK